MVKIRLCLLCGLIFCFAGACNFRSETMEDVTVYYEFGVAKKIIIARRVLKDIQPDSFEKRVYVKLAKEGAPRILGDYVIDQQVVTFKPLIPLTPGLTYELFIGGKKHSDLVIPFGDATHVPVIKMIYPDLDSLPENLLKIYIQFNQPMQEGVSAEHVFLLKGSDTLKNVFLDLQPELWDHDRTMLTLWLDPGRIKRDLQPNQKMGAPLVAGANYAIIVREGWLAGNGLAFQGGVRKPFFTTVRDTVSPDLGLWKVGQPGAGTQLPLMIDLNEPLDYQLLLNSIRVVDDKAKPVQGELSATTDGKRWIFRPDHAWVPGNYTIGIESKLEDLAGNNLNRLFDTDLAKPQKKEQKEVYRLSFTIR